MNEIFSLKTQPRVITGKKVKHLRNQQIVPLCVYGHQTEPRNLQAAYRSLESILLRAGGTNLIVLQTENEPISVLAREVQRDPIRGTIQHVDFFAVNMEERVTLDVPVIYEGTSPAVVQQGAMLILGANTISIETLPSNLPDQITINLDKLENIGDTVLVSDLVVGEGITVLNNQDEMLVSVSLSSAGRGEEEEDEEGLSDLSESLADEGPEVIGRERQEDTI